MNFKQALIKIIVFEKHQITLLCSGEMKIPQLTNKSWQSNMEYTIYVMITNNNKCIRH